jgi:hypothetical protein
MLPARARFQPQPTAPQRAWAAGMGSGRMTMAALVMRAFNLIMLQLFMPVSRRSKGSIY